ncbi:MAG: hypothetical protein WC982_14240 [Advenella sp.]
MKQSQINALNILNNVESDSTADLLEKGHKYYKREGTPGNYKYYYTEEQYNKEKGKKTDGKENKPTETIEKDGKRMDLKSNWDNMSLRERDKFLESFKKDRPDDYKLLNTSIVNLSANNFEAWSEKQQDLLSSYYMFEFID